MLITKIPQTMQLQCPRPWMRSDVTGVRTSEPGLASPGRSCAQLPCGGHTGETCSLHHFVVQCRICYLKKNYKISKVLDQKNVSGDEILSPTAWRDDPGSQ